MAHTSLVSRPFTADAQNGVVSAVRSISGQGQIFSPAERRAHGHAQRTMTPRSSHEMFQKSAYRPAPVETLVQQGEGRLRHLLPIRYGRMLASPFTFFRGSAAVMAWDMSHATHTNLSVQLCGDAHVSNFGHFGSPEGVLMFDLIDFDETIPGPFDWDVKRLATSAVLAGRSNGFSNSACKEIAQSCVARYRRKLAEFSESTTLEIWYSRVTAESLLDFIPRKRKREDVLARIQRTRKRDSHHAVSKLTETTDDELRIVERPPFVLRLPEEEVAAIIHPFFEKYLQSLPDDRAKLLDHFRYVDSAFHVSGVGSVGMRCYIVVLAGRDNNDPLVLQIKEAVSSVLASYMRATPYHNEGERIVQGQRLIQAVSDPFLGWVRHTTGRDHYIRQLFNMKASADLAAMSPALLASYAAVCGEILARAHARSGDPIELTAYLGKNEAFDEAVARFAMRYADQTEADHAELVSAVKSGQIVAETGI